MNRKYFVLAVGCVGIALIFWIDRAGFETDYMVIERTELSPDSDDHFIYHFQLINKAEHHPPWNGFVVCEFGFDNFLGRRTTSADDVDGLNGVEIPIKYRPRQFLWMQPSDPVQTVHDHYGAGAVVIWPLLGRASTTDPVGV